MPPRFGNTGRTEKRKPFQTKAATKQRNGTVEYNLTADRTTEEPPVSSDEGIDAGSEDGDSEAETGPSAYSTLLQSLQQQHEPAERSSKRRKVTKASHLDLNGVVSLPTDSDGANGQTTQKSRPAGHEHESDDEVEDGLLAGSEDDEDDDEADVLETASVASDDLSNGPGTSADSKDSYDEHFTSHSSADFTAAETGAKNAVSVVHHEGWKETFTSRGGDVSGKHLKARAHSLEDFPIKQRLKQPSCRLDLSWGTDASLALDAMFNYKDLVYAGRTPDSGARMRDLSALHLLNHVLKGRDRVLRNNEKIIKAGDSPLDDLNVQDQGFARPKVLVLLETREQAYKWIQSVLTLFEPEQRENWSRFQEAFHSDDPLPDHLPDDYKDLFEGNSDNDFRMGVKFTRKTVKLFSAFYTSDVLICSPLGLRRIIAPSDHKKRDHDFLSSIEICILDQADAMQQQNWSHVTFALSHLNLPPKDLHGADLTRIRPSYLDNHASHLRQTLILTAHLTPEINSLANTSTNIAGQIKLTPLYPGAITALPFPQRLKQTFTRFASPTPLADPDARFAHFTSAVLPSLLKLISTSSPTSPAGILVFIPSYLDFVRVRNFFAASTQTEALSFGQVSEYSTNSAARRARSHLASGRNSVLLYCGRAHHFHRYGLAGVRRVVWYGLPDNERFWGEVLAWVAKGVQEGRVGEGEVWSRAVFGRWDGLALERLVGSERVRAMLDERSGDTFEFL